MPGPTGRRRACSPMPGTRKASRSGGMRSLHSGETFDEVIEQQPPRRQGGGRPVVAAVGCLALGPGRSDARRPPQQARPRDHRAVRPADHVRADPHRRARRMAGRPFRRRVAHVRRRPRPAWFARPTSRRSRNAGDKPAAPAGKARQPLGAPATTQIVAADQAIAATAAAARARDPEPAPAEVHCLEIVEGELAEASASSSILPSVKLGRTAPAEIVVPHKASRANIASSASPMTSCSSPTSTRPTVPISTTSGSAGRRSCRSDRCSASARFRFATRSIRSNDGARSAGAPQAERVAATS